MVSKAIEDRTSPALCTPITPRGDGKIPSVARRFLQQTNYNALSGGVDPPPKKKKKLPLPLGFRHHAGGGPSHGHR